MSGVAAYDGASTTGLLTARDAIMGREEAVTVAPTPLPANKPENLENWSATVRHLTLQAEILGGLAFVDGGESVGVFHQAASGGTPTEAPKVTAEPLMDLTRPKPDDFLAQLPLIMGYAEQRADRASEIVSQVGFPTQYFATVAALNDERTKYTLELVALIQQVAARVALRTKHALAVKRPDLYSAQIQPIIPTPGHGALPSGHATEAFAAARLLINLSAGKAQAQGLALQLLALAARIAVNRTVAGVHFPADSYAGAMIGFTLADYLTARAGAKIDVKKASFHGPGVGATDFLLDDLVDGTGLGKVPSETGTLISVGDPLKTVGTSDLLGWMWHKAQGEW